MDASTQAVCVLLILCVLKFANEVNCGCNLSLKDGFGSPTPVYLHNGDFLAPNTAKGDILLRRSETLQVACPGNKRFIVLGNDTTDDNIFSVKCVKNTTFQGVRSVWVGNLNEIKCNGPPWFTTEEAGKCYDGNVMYRVGYRIANKFYPLYEACFDKNLLHTVYVKQELTPASVYLQPGGRPQFIEGDVFGKAKMSKLYKVENQKERIKEILGSGMEDKYISKKQFLNRGHLAPRADFALLAEQRASFHYINTAPQWNRGNAGDWAALEDALRRRVHTLGSAGQVYTGTYGVFTLADASNSQRPVYLDVDDNNNDVVPVPLYFFKVVYEPVKKTATAFISINSPYYNRSTIERLSFCSDICEQNSQFSWLRWRSNDGTHSFCCTYDDFVEHIDVLPKLNVKGVFY